jgi:Flp pilus assembly protein TadD
MPLRLAFDGQPSAPVLLVLAGAEAEAGLLDHAIARQERWLEAHPDATRVRMSLAGHYTLAEREEDARAQYEHVLAAEPDHVAALNNLGWALIDSDLPQALALAERAAALAPAELNVLHTLAQAQVAAADWRRAGLTLDSALARAPSDPDLLWLSAQVLLAEARPTRAARQLERLLDVDAAFSERDAAADLLERIRDMHPTGPRGLTW